MNRITDIESFLADYQESDQFRDLLRSEDCNKDAHEYGNFGLTHRQFIDAYKEYAYDLNQWDGLSDELYEVIIKELNETEAWHIENSSIDNEI